MGRSSLDRGPLMAGLEVPPMLLTIADQLRSSRGENGKLPRLLRSEGIADPHAHDIVAQLHLGVDASAAQEGERSKVEVEIFEPARPVAEKFLLDADAGRGPDANRALRERRTDDGDGRTLRDGAGRVEY